MNEHEKIIIDDEEEENKLVKENASVSASSDDRSSTETKCVLKGFTILGKFIFNIIKPFIFISIYSIIGAGAFYGLERPHDLRERASAIEEREIAKVNLVDQLKLGDILERLDSSFDKRLYFFKLINQFELDIEANISPETVWHFWNCLLYSGTVYTTIGYGHIACATTGGRVCTIFYALIGMPITLVCLNDLGKMLLVLVQFVSDQCDIIFSAICSVVMFLLRKVFWCRKKKKKKSEDITAAEKPLLGLGSPDLARSKMAMFNEEGDIYPEDPIQRPRTSIMKSMDTLASSELPDVRIEIDDEEDEVQMMLIEVENNPPVLAALFFTFGWMFACGGLLCYWEGWDFFDSFYFFFVSLSTIGFGDFVPQRGEFMVIVLLLVIIGLAMFSVCLNVVQEKIEIIYMELLSSMLGEYQRGVKRGGQAGASMGMMRMWDGNKKAKYLMPLLGKSKRQNVMEKFKEEAKAQGIEIPTVFEDMDPESGMPSIFNVEEKKMEEYVVKVEEEVRQEKAANEIKKKPNFAHVGIQVLPDKIDFELQTDLIASLVSVLSQTSLDYEIAHPEVDHIEQQTYCSMFHLTEAISQTSLTETQSQLLQTASSMFQLREIHSQTEIFDFADQQSQIGVSFINDMREMETQVGTSANDLIAARMQTDIIQTDDKDAQACVTCESIESQTLASMANLAEFGSQTELNTTEVEIQATTETTVMDSQTISSYFDLTDCLSQTELELTEIGSQAVVDQYDCGDIQTQLSYFDLTESMSQTIEIDKVDQDMQATTSMSDLASQTMTDSGTQSCQTSIETESDSCQTSIDTENMLLQTEMSFFNFSDNECQTESSEQTHREIQVTQEMEDNEQQAGSSWWDLREAYSQIDIENGYDDKTQTDISYFGRQDQIVQASPDLSTTKLQTDFSIFNVRNREMQTLKRSPEDLERKCDVGVQTGVLARIEHLSTKTKKVRALHVPDQGERHIFKRPPLRRISRSRDSSPQKSIEKIPTLKKVRLGSGGEKTIGGEQNEHELERLRREMRHGRHTERQDRVASLAKKFGVGKPEDPDEAGPSK